MKCPNCNAEIPDYSASCPNCGQNITQTNNSQPNYQTSYQGATPYYYYSAPGYVNTGMPQAQREKTVGEIVAIVAAVIVSVLSLFAAMIILSYYVSRFPSDTSHDNYGYDDFSSYYDGFEQYGIDDFTDEDSLEHFFDYYNSMLGEESQYPISNPAKEHTSIKFDDYLYSFSNGSVNTDYNVELNEVYRGDAALKLLEGAKLPDIDNGMEIYLAQFKLTVTEQETEAYVTASPSVFTSAYKGEESGVASSEYDSLTNIDYKDANQLLKKGESGIRWMAFVVEKNDERPLIMWDKYEGEYFRYSKAAISSAEGLEAGAAVEKQSKVSSN